MLFLILQKLEKKEFLHLKTHCLEMVLNLFIDENWVGKFIIFLLNYYV